MWWFGVGLVDRGFTDGITKPQRRQGKFTASETNVGMR